MNTLLFWVVIGMLGFVLYISPGFFIHRMYESFNAPAATNPVPPAATGVAKATTVDASGSTAVNLQPTPNAATQALPAGLDNLMKILGTPMPTESPTAPPETPQSNSGTSIPQEHSTTSSQPEAAKVAAAPSQALQQGDLFNTTTPQNPQPGTQGMLGSMGTQPRAPAERVVYVDRRRDDDDWEEKCQQQPARNPNCPDMRDYIRKDSIPCWGCKLR